MTKNRRKESNTEDASTSATNMATRVEMLESNVQAGLKELKDHILGTQGTPESSGAVSLCLSKIAEFEKNVMEAIKSVKKEIEGVNEKISEERQERTTNSLVINGIPEKDGSNDYEEVCKVVKNFLKIDITMADIDFCYRIGKKESTDKVRPLTVRFVNRWFRDKIFSEKRKLKGSKVVISEFLLSKTLALYKKVRDKVGVKSCWTWKGGIYVLDGNSRKKIRNLSDIHN